MALPFTLLLLSLVWALGALQLWPRTQWMRAALPWIGGALALSVAACVVAGIVGLVRSGSWGSPSAAQFLHRVLGEGNLPMRRTDWAWLNNASNITLSLDVAWLLLALCFASLHGYVYWGGVAERRRQRRALRIRRGLQ